MAKGVEAHHLQDQAQRHRWNAESVVPDGAHRDEPGDYDRHKGEIGKVGVDALHRSQPEEADEEE